MEFRILGPLEVLAAGEAVPLGSAQQRAVLGLLLVHAPEPVSVDRLVDELWGDRAPATARHAVQVHVSAIRKALKAPDGAATVRTVPKGYLLDVDGGSIDARRFERLIEDAQRLLEPDPAASRRTFEVALELWRGEPFADCDASEWLMREGDRLGAVRTVALEGLAEARLALGEPAEALDVLTGLVAADPLRERPRRLLMLALYRCGRHAEALAAYRNACAALDDLGLQPGPALRQLEAAILRHDSSLGAPAAEPPVSAERAQPPHRKLVTVLFCAVTGSPTLDPEARHAVMNRYWQEVRAVVERHGGTAEKFHGDAVMAVFGVPRVREDDALRAVRAAAEFRARLPAVAAQVGVALTVRSAMNTGVVLAGEAESIAIGDAVSAAAKLGQAATQGDILLGEETLRLVRGAVEVEPVGLEGETAAYRLLTVDPLAPGLRRRLDAPLVGRRRELDVLASAWRRAVDERGCHLFTLMGVAGVGKSRLVLELLSAVDEEATVLSGRCLHYGEGITFWPLIEALTPVGDPAAVVLERLGSGGAATPEELFWEVRRLLESLAARRPVILHVDDLQWAEPMLLDLLEHVADLSRGAPILLLCTARPELLEDRPAWSGGKLNASTVLLEPLDTESCRRLVDQLGNGLEPPDRVRVIAASEGNPLFLEEMVAFAQEHGRVELPPTIQALLTARLERLSSAERALLECGSIEGEVFHDAPVRALADADLSRDLDRQLGTLVRKELVRPHPATFEGRQAFRFRHALIRDAAYDGLPKAARAEFHMRFADWLEHQAAELQERDEITGWHLEQATRYRRELRLTVDPALVRNAAGHLRAAGRRAAERSDLAAARNLLGRAHALVTEDHALRARIAMDLAEQLVDGSDLSDVDALLSETERDPAMAAHGLLTRLEWMIRADPAQFQGIAERALPQMLAQFADAGDERSLARANLVAHWVNMMDAHATPAAEQALRAAEHAGRAGDPGLRARALGVYIPALLYGRDAAATIAARLDAIAAEEPGPYVGAFLSLGRAEVERLHGHAENARRLLQAAIERFRALGIEAFAGASQIHVAWVEQFGGDPQRALPIMLDSDARLAAMGEQAFRSTVQAMLAQMHALLGDRDSALNELGLAHELSGDEDVVNVVIADRLRSHFARIDGDLETAERCARSAVEHAGRTDYPSFRSDAALELALVLCALRRQDEAAEHAQTARDLASAKGDRPRAAAAQRVIDEILAAPRTRARH